MAYLLVLNPLDVWSGAALARLHLLAPDATVIRSEDCPPRTAYLTQVIAGLEQLDETTACLWATKDALS